MTLIQQVYGPFFLRTLAALVALDVLSFLTLHSVWETILFGAFTLALVVIAIRKPEWLLPLALAEVISTSNGHSLNVELFGVSIGLRMVVFAVLLVATAWKCAKNRTTYLTSSRFLVLFLFASVVILALVQGIVAGHSIRDVYLDTNGYLAFLYIWAAIVWVQTSKDRHRLFQAFGAGVTWLTSKTLLFVLLFAHMQGKALVPINTWIRDTRLGELTFQFDHVYRVFLQSQWFVVVALLLVVAYLVFERHRDSHARLMVIPMFSVLLISLSRSFWVGALAGGIVLLGWFVLKGRMRPFFNRLFTFVTLGVASVAWLYVLVALPIQGLQRASLGTLFSQRATKTSDIAIDSRKQLLPPLLSAFGEAPIQGHGLGKNVRYRTQDPKYIESHNTDLVSTYAFEWGWIDVLVKFGVVGTAMLLLVLILCVREF